MLARIWQIVRGALFEWTEDKAMRMAAAIAFYTLFALTPIVIISMSVAERFFEKEAVKAEMLDQVRFLVGDEGADAVKLLIESAPKDRTTSWHATIIGLLTLFFAATGVFVELKDSLNTIWEVAPRPGLGIVEMIYDRITSFAMVLVIGFLLLVSMMIDTMLAAFMRAAGAYLPESITTLISLVNFLVSFGVVTLLFALIYKILPDAKVAWHHVWLGAIVTAVLFAVGKALFSWYLVHSTITSSYGPAGSLVIIVLWTYYSALILLFGAEITQVSTRLAGEFAAPTEKAVHVSEHSRVQQGITHQDGIEAAAKESENSP